MRHNVADAANDGSVQASEDNITTGSSILNNAPFRFLLTGGDRFWSMAPPMKLWSVSMVLSAALAAGAGCGHDVARLDARETSDPMLRRAAEKAAAGDAEYAIDLYRKALDLEPKLARASLDMAILLHDVKQAYVPALYHYQRYLVLRPNTQKRDLIENRMRLARQSLAAELSPQAADRAVQNELAELRKVHAQLQTRYQALQRELAQARTPAPPAPDEPTAETASKTHVVRPGENLTHIAQRYGVEVADMVEINGLRNPNAIVAGQKLIVPARRAP